MADRADGGALITAKRRQQPARRTRRHIPRKSCSSRVSLEKVLGISTVSSSGLTSDPNSGLIAYPAGCVIVLLQPKTNRQTHIINACRKPFTAVAFSPDGKHLVTGESGHMPCVRVWEVDGGGGQVAEVQSHKYGISCVAFSSNSIYIVSVGFQHDRTVSVWDWKKGSIIASNKVSSRVLSVSFSQDNSYFVTAGNRHVKFWYLDASKERRVNSTVPLIGRSGLLDHHKNSVFCGVACGRGLLANNTYCITSCGLLCLFNSSRHLEAWVSLKVSAASCLAVSEDFIFCGCSDGVIRVFRPPDLQYVTTLQRPHRLGVDLARSAHHGPLPASSEAQYPDMLALTFDPRGKHLACVYSDHSVYVWDVKDVRDVRKLYSALYHSSCVWSVEVYPELQDPSQACLPESSFFTCSSDNTIRLWNTNPSTRSRNLYSQDLLRILYVGENTQHLQGERGEAAGADGKAGVRILGVSPDGQHLAAGDRCGNLRIFGLQFLDELVKIEAHDSDVLCLEFSPLSTGVKLLASASRDRLIHVFNLERNYSLEQTLSDHSASITAVKFTGENPEVRMVSCGADKSIYFCTAEQTVDGLTFSRSHHVVEKTTLYDMDLDSSRTHVAIACQDRNVRVYNVETGKLKKCLKGSSSDEGSLLKVQMDPSGSFFATSCSDKNITIYDYESGECVATLFGHSEIVTCMRFSQDCRHLISVSGDGCVFVWRLDPHMTSTMRKRRGLRAAQDTCSQKQPNIRRETFITMPSAPLLQLQEELDLKTPGKLGPGPGEEEVVVKSPEVTSLLHTNGKLPTWFRKLAQGEDASVVQSDAEPRQVRGRWAEQPNTLIVCANSTPSPTRSQDEEEEEEDFHVQSLEGLLADEEEVLQTAGEGNTFIVPPDSSSASSDRVEGVSCPQLEASVQGAEPVWRTQLSPDSACSEGSTGSLEQQHDPDTDSLSQGSSVGSLGLEDDEDSNSVKNHFETLVSSLDERFDTDPTSLQPPEEKHFLNPRLSISTRFLSRFQDRVRAWPVRAPPPISVPHKISEESNVRSVRSKSSCVVIAASEGSTSSSAVRCPQPVLGRRTSCGTSQRRPPHRRRTALVVQCRRTLGALPSRTLMDNSSISEASVLQEPAQIFYMETSGSSRDTPTSITTSSSLEENKENLSSSSNLLPAEVSCVSGGPNLDTSKTEDPQDQTSGPHKLATPTLVMSQDRCRRWSSSTEETMIQGPALFTTPTTSAAVEGAGPGVEETVIQTDPDVSSADAPPMSSSWSPAERLLPPPSDDFTGQPGGDEDEESARVQQVVDELRQAARRAVRLFQQLGESEQAEQNLSVLQEAFSAVNSELQAVMQPDDGRSNNGGRSSSDPSGLLQDDRTKSLLEKYSDLLIQMTLNKMNRI